MCVVTSEREAGNLEFSIKIKSVHFECRKRGTLYTNNINFTMLRSCISYSVK